MSSPVDGDRARRVDGELQVAGSFAALAVLGAAVGSLPLALAGALGALGVVSLYLWQRYCLVALGYRRALSAERAGFGEEVTLEVELVNDKLLPLSWLQVSDRVPSGLDLVGANVVTSDQVGSQLVSVLALLPYQRVRRRLVVRCSQRGLHRFGPCVVRSGDPLGVRVREASFAETHELLVYPKRFALDATAILSRSLVGELRARRAPLEDPSRIAGVRPYRPGDPLRSIDWRASARSPGLQVREFEPSVSRSVAVLVDYRIPLRAGRAESRSELELVIAVAASLVSELAESHSAVGLWASGALDDVPLAFPPRRGPEQLPAVLEALARCPAVDRVAFSSVLAAQVGVLRAGTSVVVVAVDFPEPTLLALAELRRRHHVSAVWVSGTVGEPPSPEVVDVTFEVPHTEDWRDRDVVDLAA